jgi:hypothetical protein
MPSVDPAPIHAPSADAHARLAADLSAFPVALRRPLIKVPLPLPPAGTDTGNSPQHEQAASGDGANEAERSHHHHGISAAFASGVRSACLRAHDQSTGRSEWFRLKGCGNNDQVRGKRRVGLQLSFESHRKFFVFVLFSFSTPPLIPTPYLLSPSPIKTRVCRA